MPENFSWTGVKDAAPLVDLPNTTVADIPRRVPRIAPAPWQKGLLASAIGAAVAQQPDPRNIDLGSIVHTVSQNIKQTTPAGVAMNILSQEQDLGISGRTPQSQQFQQQAADRNEFANSVSTMDQLGAAFRQFTVPGNIYAGWDGNDLPPDPTFNVMQGPNWAKDTTNRDQADIEYLLESTSQPDYDRRLAEVERNAEDFRVIGAHGTGAALLTSLAAGVADPVGWVLGYGVGKVAQLGGVGARVALAEGQIARGLAYGAAEGAVGNVLGTAALDAAGAHISHNDYLMAAGFGGIMGLGLLGPAAFREHATGQVKAMMNAALENEHATLRSIQDELGPDASSQEVVQAYTERVNRNIQQAEKDALTEQPNENRFAPPGTKVADMTQEQAQARLQQLMRERGIETPPPASAAPGEATGAPVEPFLPGEGAASTTAPEGNVAEAIRNTPRPEADRFLPDFQGQMDEAGNLPPLESEFLPPEINQRIQDEFALPTADTAENRVLREMIGRAVLWNTRNHIDEEKLAGLVAKMPWLRSTALTMGQSKNPVLRMIFGTLIESNQGADVLRDAAGNVITRRQSAAVSKYIRERSYLQTMTGVETQYRAWRNQNGGSTLRDIMGTQHRAKFNRLLSEEIRAREVQDPNLTTDPTIRQAADLLEGGYSLMRRDQQAMGTIGAARLGDNSYGYAPRRLNVDFIRTASNAQLQAIKETIARQLASDTERFDPAFAAVVADRYVERVRLRGYNYAFRANDTPGFGDMNEQARGLTDTLRAEGIPDEEIELLLGRFSRGGAGHTKARLALDLNQNVETSEGHTFKLGDAFEQDQFKLYQQYARRVSGEVALAGFGIQGQPGVALLRKSLAYGEPGVRATPEEVRAFDVAMSEMLGQPYGTQSEVLANLRSIVAASRLGGMGFTQFAESFNGLGALGTHATFQSIKAIPRLVQEIRLGKPNPILDSLEAAGARLEGDLNVTFPYQLPDSVRVYGADSVGAFTRMLRAGANAVPHLSGWHYIHGAQVRGMSEQIVYKLFRYLKSGENDPALRNMGFSDELMTRLRDDLDNIATFDKDGTLTALDITKASDLDAMNATVQNVWRGARQIIQGTFVGETGAWAHDDMLKLLTQFRSFGITAMEKQWARQRNTFGTIQSFGLLLGAMGWAIPLHLARVQANSAFAPDREEYLEKNLAPGALVRAVLNYSSLAGVTGDLLDGGLSVLAGGDSDSVRGKIIEAMGGKEQLGIRGSVGGGLTSAIPAVGYVNDLGKLLTDPSVDRVRRLVPGGNIPFIMPFFNSIENLSDNE